MPEGGDEAGSMRGVSDYQRPTLDRLDRRSRDVPMVAEVIDQTSASDAISGGVIISSEVVSAISNDWLNDLIVCCMRIETNMFIGSVQRS